MMYGTVSYMRVKPGMGERFAGIARTYEATKIPGLLFEHVYRLDADAETFMLVVAFTSRETYEANAENPEQHTRYLAMRELLAADPEWHDGEIVYSHSFA